jgi:CubicO group peptidase (beta-lactamase class C family)
MRGPQIGPIEEVSVNPKKPTKGLLALVFLVAAMPAAPAAQFTPFEAAVAAFDAEVAAGVADDAGGCVSVAVFIGDEVVWAKGYGWADIENRIAATPKTIGRTGSISKSFTAVLLMQLAERGVLAIDDPVVGYFPAVAGLAGAPEGMEPITFRMLASHTAGLIREPELRGAAVGPIQGWEGKVLASIPQTRFQTVPRTEYAYSNIGFGILGLAASRAAGTPFMELVEALIFAPLGMSSSTFVVNTPELAARLSVGYSRDRETGALSAEQATREHFGRGYKVPNGGIYSTVTDMAKFAAAMMGESPVAILSASSRREMLTPQPPATGYGLGFQIREQDGVTVAGHGGSVAGYNAGLWFDPDSKVGVAMLRTTSYDPPITELLVTLARAEGR